MSNAHYFPHDYHARHDPKLLALRRRHGLAGLGAYWCLVEFIYEQDGAVTGEALHDLAYDLRCEEDLLASLIYDFGLFSYDQERKVVTCAAVTERLQLRAEKREQAQKNAKNRWSSANAMPTHSDRIATAMPSHSDRIATAETSQSVRNANKGKERKEKEIKEDSKLTLQDAEGVVVSKTPTELEEVALLISPGAREAWAGYLELRRRQRWPVTVYALRLIARKLQQLRPDDEDGQRYLLETAAERGWRSVFEPRDQNPTQPRTHDPKPTLDQKYNDHAHALAAKWGVR